MRCWTRPRPMPPVPKRLCATDAGLLCLCATPCSIADVDLDATQEGDGVVFANYCVGFADELLDEF